MDERVLEEIRFHQDVVTKDANSPLYQIREKEMEITGRVLAARDQAEKLVSDARGKAAEIVKSAGTDAERLSKERADAVLAEANTAVSEIEAQGKSDVAALEAALVERQGEAADFVVQMVTTI
jgi:vacuolar-type H+-ATPase subunit H